MIFIFFFFMSSINDSISPSFMPPHTFVLTLRAVCLHRLLNLKATQPTVEFGGIRFLHVKGFDSLSFKDSIIPQMILTDVRFGPLSLQKSPVNCLCCPHFSHLYNFYAAISFKLAGFE